MESWRGKEIRRRRIKPSVLRDLNPRPQDQKHLLCRCDTTAAQNFNCLLSLSRIASRWTVSTQIVIVWDGASLGHGHKNCFHFHLLRRWRRCRHRLSQQEYLKTSPASENNWMSLMEGSFCCVERKRHLMQNLVKVLIFLLTGFHWLRQSVNLPNQLRFSSKRLIKGDVSAALLLLYY